jgi:predicted phage baseplate assembly protein
MQEQPMTLPSPNLDDLRFQRDLVDEARKRIINYNPEWTEYNLSDPGITLIELFAWMTELTLYRLNRVPEKNYIKFLEMLGLQLNPASSARTELTFWLSADLPLNPEDDQTVIVPAGFEVRSELTDEEVLFTTTRSLEIFPPLLEHVRKDDEFNKNHLTRMGIEPFLPFNERTPRSGDTFYLGFNPANNISGHILKLDFESEPTEAVGIRRDDPPWVWECMTRDGAWQEVHPSKYEGEKDSTGGLNNEEGQLVLYLPLTAEPGSLYGLNAFWLRCRIEQRNPLQGMYSESPRVNSITAYSMGATVPAMHSLSVLAEHLGISDGEPGQTFTLLNSPVLTLQEGETLEVEELHQDETVYVPWKLVDGFSKSNYFDRHFVLSMGTGTVHFGPSVRQPDGTVIQYGRIPENGRSLRFSRYRYGGGVTGNLPSSALTTMGSSLAYVSRVSNLVRASGGRDQETIEELKLRAQRELQAQRRAVTAQDYEQFTLSDSRYSRPVARARCLSPQSTQEAAGTVSVLVVPAVQEDIKAGSLVALALADELRQEIRTHLDQYRLITTSLNIREPRYTGVQVRAKIVPQDFTRPDEVIRSVNTELKRYLTPLALDDGQPLLNTGEKWTGWEFGRDLFTAEVISLIQQVPSVKFVLDVEVLSRPVVPLEEKDIFDDVSPPAMTTVQKVLRIPADGLVCSLEHDIELVSIEDAYEKDQAK